MSHTSVLINELATCLSAQHLTLVTAESCTGGMIAAACTDLPGSSRWFECGFVTYSNRAKQRDLNVPEHILLSHGAVSEETVKAMVAGAAIHGDVAVAVSGIAGPGGAVEGKPVGTVWIGWGSKTEQHACLCKFDGDRSEVRQQTLDRALTQLIEYVKKY
ncbi:CinA family protein [Thalassolituus maritimus]|uniref:CinA family protein n=1 Tax=Thalassolituus maritimus TaxID=484498 RepID=A0ABQ0A1W6_9GAMM